MRNKDRKREDKKQQAASNLEEKVLFVNRCAKVVKGGRRFSFSALVLVADDKGKIGFGFAKANELTDAIRKGGALAKGNLVTFERNKSTIPHEVIAEWDGAKVLLKPAREGAGIIAGSYIRSILEMAGVKDVVAKSLGSGNPINQVRATFKALSELRNREEVKQLRGWNNGRAA